MRSRIKLREYLAILCAALAAGVPAAVRAQDYPSRPVMMVNTWAPGGPSDAIIRPLLEKFSQKFGQPFVLENRSGANGSIGTSYVARSRNDGYTLLFANVGPIAISPWLPDKPSYDSIKDFQPIGQIVSGSTVLVVAPSFPASNMREFIDYAKKHPGKITYGSVGIGSSTHVAGATLAKMAGIQMTHVPYKGAAPAIQDLLAGNITAVFDNVTGPISLIKAGQVTALGVTTEERIAVLPDVPTIAESGLPAFKNSSWISIFTRAGVPPAVLARLESAVLAAARDPETVAKLKELGAIPAPMNTAELDRFWRSEFTYWRDAIKAANLTLE